MGHLWRDAMTPDFAGLIRPAPRASGTLGQLARKDAFEKSHPHVKIVPVSHRWQAQVSLPAGSETTTEDSLEVLMDEVELRDLRGKVQERGLRGLSMHALYQLRCLLEKKLKTLPVDDDTAAILRREHVAAIAELTTRSEARSRTEELDW